MASISRQKAFRQAVAIHLLLVLTAVWTVYVRSRMLCVGGDIGIGLLGQFLLVAGIVEGATLLGWRLTQLPKSQALEFLLVTPLRPRRVFLAEALIGLARLGLVTLAGLPALVFLIGVGGLAVSDLGPLLFMPFTWGAVTGLGLTIWAYEPVTVRRWGERGLFLLIVLYLIVGVLVGEHLDDWLTALPGGMGRPLRTGFWNLHLYSPFTVMQMWLEPASLLQGWLAGERMIGLEMAALLLIGGLLARGSGRLKGHFHDRHYRPARDRSERGRDPVGDRPLSWWAVKRVTEYSGRVNLWLAGGFGVLYAAYTATGPAWPPWLGRQVFVIAEQMLGGIPVLAAALVVLAAVPAAFQYGLWDSNAQDRCRRLELLLLTRLKASDYWEAASAAAWRRGRGYFVIAGLLWAAAAWAGQISPFQLIAALASSAVLWGLYFTLGFRAFSRGMQGNGLGSLLTLGLPLLALGLFRNGWPTLAALLPPGNVYAAAITPPTFPWALGPLSTGALALLLGRHARQNCDRELRRWYELHHGKKLLD